MGESGPSVRLISWVLLRYQNSGTNCFECADLVCHHLITNYLVFANCVRKQPYPLLTRRRSSKKNTRLEIFNMLWLNLC